VGVEFSLAVWLWLIRLIGLLARGLTEIGVVGKQAEWSWIFIIEGLLVGKISHILERG
jgi:hypothetical protein